LKIVRAQKVYNPENTAGQEGSFFRIPKAFTGSSIGSI
jgi:hypothetical protein